MTDAIGLRSHHLLQLIESESLQKLDWEAIFFWLESVVDLSFKRVSSWKPSEEENEPFVAHLFGMDVLGKESLLVMARKLTHSKSAYNMLGMLHSILTNLCDSPQAQRYVPDNFLEMVEEIIGFAKGATSSETWNDIIIPEKLEQLKNSLERCKPLVSAARAEKASVHDPLYLSQRYARLA